MKLKIFSNNYKIGKNIREKIQFKFKKNYLNKFSYFMRIK